MKSPGQSASRFLRGAAWLALAVVSGVVGPIIAAGIGMAFHEVVLAGPERAAQPEAEQAPAHSAEPAVSTFVTAEPETAPSTAAETSTSAMAASDANAEAASEAFPQSGMFGSGVRAVGAMIVVLALIFILMALAKRYMPQKFGRLGTHRRIQVVETVHIGEKRSLTLVEVDGTNLLLASTPTSVSLLKEIRPEDRSAAADRTEFAVPNVVRKDRADAVSANASPLFKDTLAAEVGHQGAIPASNPLARLARLRQKLEVQ